MRTAQETMNVLPCADQASRTLWIWHVNLAVMERQTNSQSFRVTRNTTPSVVRCTSGADTRAHLPPQLEFQAT